MNASADTLSQHSRVALCSSVMYLNVVSLVNSPTSIFALNTLFETYFVWVNVWERVSYLCDFKFVLPELFYACQNNFL